MLPNFGFRVQADTGPQTNADKTDNNGRDALLVPLKGGNAALQELIPAEAQP